ncbi:unnamed protein product [Bathycoccus prasinos]
MLQLSAWNIMHKDLIPLILTYSQERNLVYHAVKLIAFLTLPTEKSATNVQEQNRAHLNELNALIENEHIFATVLGLIIEPLQQLESIGGANFKNSESKSLQLVLTFYRNLLIIAEEENNTRVKRILSSCLLRYGFLDVLLVLVQNHKKILSHEDMALTIEILQLLFRGIPPQVIIAELDGAKDISEDKNKTADLKIALNFKFQSHRFKGKFEQFSTCGLQILSKLLHHSSERKMQTSIQAVADIFESSFIHWLRMEWIALEQKKDYYGANLVCGAIVEILSIIQKLSVFGTQVEKDILKIQQGYHTSDKLRDIWNIHDDSIIQHHVQILKNENQAEAVLDSVCNYLQNLVNAGHVEKLFTFRHLVCLHGFTVTSKLNPNFRAGPTAELKKICRFVLNCFLASLVKQDQKCDRQKMFLQIPVS